MYCNKDVLKNLLKSQSTRINIHLNPNATKDRYSLLKEGELNAFGYQTAH